MNTTGLEMTQAIIEWFGGFICLMLLVVIIINGKGKKSWNQLKHLLVVTSLLFFSEACAYFFRGNTNTVGMKMTRISNFCVFYLNIILVFFFVRYIYSLLQEKRVFPKIIYKKIVYLFTFVNAAIIIINLFTGWMYYFDESNCYHRNTLWYVYTILNLLTILLIGVMAINYRKSMSKMMTLSILFFVLVPIIAIVIQVFVYGISVINIGVFLALLLILFAYLKEWSGQKNDQTRQNKLLEFVVLFLIMALTMSASIVSCVISIERISNSNDQNEGMTIANMIGSEVENQFMKPIIVSDTMSKDYNMKELMIRSVQQSPESVEEEMSAYLDSIRQGFGYQMVFAVCDETKAYYSWKGITKYIDVEKNDHDIWYKLFLESGKECDLDVDIDEANQWSLSVFVNKEIIDESGNFLGICGVGVEMTQLRNLLKKYEEMYQVKINLVDQDGIVQIDTLEENIEQKTLEHSYFDKVDSDTFYYEKQTGKIRMTKYVKSLDWYLVVEYPNQGRINALEISATSIVIFAIGIMMMGIVLTVVYTRERKTSRELIEKRKISITDDLTGLFNRRAYDEDSKKILKNQAIDKMTLVMMDVNGLKTVNDVYGHMAGDELIIRAGKCIQNSLGKYGKIYRIGGDEFVALLQCSQSQMEDAVSTLEYMTAKWKQTHEYDLAISKGVVVCKDHMDLSFDEMKELADQLMYKDKEEYYLRTGKEHRQV